MTRQHVLSGIDRPEIFLPLLAGRRVGLMTNPTGVTHDLVSTIDVLRSRADLTALFAVEHGIRGAAQAGDRVATAVDPETGITVYSVFGDSNRLTAEMLEAFDVFVFDIQDVGARFYTYMYSLAYAMEECAKAGKSVVVLDRVNPIGGTKRAGILLDRKLRSFVGDYELPTQYGLTMGEVARYVRDYLKLDLDLNVVPLAGWERRMLLDDTDLPWVRPSPNCQNLDAALCYPGTCIFEGTNLSEGRGTTIPFQIVGAPWLDGGELERALARIETPGVRFRRVSFCPTFSKHAGELCHGVQMHITDREICDVPAAGLALLDTVRALGGERFSFLPGEDGRPCAFDRLLGTDEYRLGRRTARELIEANKPRIREFSEKVQQYQLYE